MLFHRTMKTEVAHDGRDERVVLEVTAFLHRDGDDGHDLVAVDDVALRIDREAAVGVSVVGDADVGAFAHDMRGELLEMRRADAVVDVEPVGVGTDHRDACARIAERLGRDSGCRAVRAVEYDMDAVEPVRQRAEQVKDVAVLGVCEPGDAADVGPGGLQLGLREGVLDALLDDVGQLDASAREDLDPVVGRRVVGCRDHDAEVGVAIGDQERGGGRRQHAGIEHVDTRGGESCSDGRREELTRDAGIARDDSGQALACGTAGIGRATLAQDDGSRLGQGECEVGGEGAVGQPPHAVRAEQRHRIDSR